MNRAYFNEQAETWDETVAEKDAAKLKRMAERLDIKPGATVLDVGTGTGVFLPFLLNNMEVAGQVVALDFAEKMLARARDKGFSGNIDFLQADAANLPLGEELFDVIVCYSSFPHFNDKPKVLAEMSRVMKSGGRLLICHTSSRSEINEIHRQNPAVKNDLLPDQDEMQLLLGTAGFTEIKIEDNQDSYLTSAKKTR